VASDVTTTIMAQRLELDNKNKTVQMLQKALSQQRELTVYHAKEMEKEGQKRLELQREEYESAVQRHQCFIDQVSGREEEEPCSQTTHGFCTSPGLPTSSFWLLTARGGRVKPPTFSLHFALLFVIKNWMVGRPGNEATR